MKFAIMGMEPRGEWERLDDAEQNQRVRRHQEILDEHTDQHGRRKVGSFGGEPGVVSETLPIPIRVHQFSPVVLDGLRIGEWRD